MHKNKNTPNSHSFLALAFFRGICLSWHQRIRNQHKILHFFYWAFIAANWNWPYALYIKTWLYEASKTNKFDSCSSVDLISSVSLSVLLSSKIFTFASAVKICCPFSDSILSSSIFSSLTASYVNWTSECHPSLLTFTTNRCWQVLDKTPSTCPCDLLIRVQLA